MALSMYTKVPLAVRKHRTASVFQRVSERLRDSEEIAALAVRRDALALQYVSERLRDSGKLATVAVGA